MFISHWQKDGYTAMLLVQGFNALCVKASAIAQLFGCYGDVLKVGVPSCIEENVVVLPNISSPFSMKVMVQNTTHQNDCASALVRMRHSAQVLKD